MNRVSWLVLFACVAVVWASAGTAHAAPRCANGVCAAPAAAGDRGAGGLGSGAGEYFGGARGPVRGLGLRVLDRATHPFAGRFVGGGLLRGRCRGCR